MRLRSITSHNSKFEFIFNNLKLIFPPNLENKINYNMKKLNIVNSSTANFTSLSLELCYLPGTIDYDRLLGAQFTIHNFFFKHRQSTQKHNRYGALKLFSYIKIRCFSLVPITYLSDD